MLQLLHDKVWQNPPPKTRNSATHVFASPLLVKIQSDIFFDRSLRPSQGRYHKILETFFKEPFSRCANIALRYFRLFSISKPFALRRFFLHSLFSVPFCKRSTIQMRTTSFLLFLPFFHFFLVPQKAWRNENSLSSPASHDQKKDIFPPSARLSQPDLYSEYLYFLLQPLARDGWMEHFESREQISRNAGADFQVDFFGTTAAADEAKLHH